MRSQDDLYPVIDVFAGPGGLGEGFASARGETSDARFQSTVSIERDAFSYQTLLMRHFFRHFPNGEAPEDYYAFLGGDLTDSELFNRYPDAYAHATASALRISLGRENHAHVREIIRRRLQGRKLWVLVGGPPCQAYSLVGRSRMRGHPGFEEDERHTLYLEYLRIIADHSPPVFVMENVKGLLSATVRGVSTISRIVSDLRRPVSAIADAPADLSYRLYSLTEEVVAEGSVDPRIFLVRAEDHGVPQARHRMFIVGVRSDLTVSPSILERSAAPTVRDTIASLPAVRSGLSRQRDSRDAWLRAIRGICSLRTEPDENSREQWWTSRLGAHALAGLNSPELRSARNYPEWKPTHNALLDIHDGRLSVLTAHVARGHMESDLHRYLFSAAFAQEFGRSPKLADFPDGLLPNHRNVEDGRSGKMFSDRFRVQLPDQVSTTITSHISKDGHYYIHYDPAQCRSLTVREAARLQTFPDNYFFAGPRTAQYHQVGNAVPPYLARQIADIIGDVLDTVNAAD